jgi:hypothetical protein
MKELEEVVLDELETVSGGLFDSQPSPGEERLTNAMASQVEQAVANPALARRRRRDM